jgi:hypothetical protein
MATDCARAIPWVYFLAPWGLQLELAAVKELRPDVIAHRKAHGLKPSATDCTTPAGVTGTGAPTGFGAPTGIGGPQPPAAGN